jgi:acyl-CoA thioesterase-2|tara:strand:+ start:1674 stop:2531 length:858 start_codon:yes stop_codon:yes gene_type:complete
MSHAERNTIDLPRLMTVEPLETVNTFVGQAESYGLLGIYGGHFVGQALSAGFLTVEDDKFAQSLHAYFLRKGDPEQPIVYKVEHLKTGKGVEVRNISAIQSQQVCFSMMASYKRPEESDEHQPEMPIVISPEELCLELASKEQKFNPPMMIAGRAELRLISDSFVPEDFTPGRAPALKSWMRSTHERDLSIRESQCVLGFLSDGTLMFNSVLPYGVPFQTHMLTSLDHSVWFHHHADVRDWMLFDQRSTAAADGRGMNEGKVYTRSGKLVFSTSQESMLRRMPTG